MLDYNTYVWIAQLVILGLSVGYLRDQLNSLKADKEDEVGYLDSRLKDIEDINIINAKLKDELETQVINQSDSLGKIFEITSTLDKDEPEEVFSMLQKLFQNLWIVKRLQYIMYPTEILQDLWHLHHIMPRNWVIQLNIQNIQKCMKH